ncbi:MAG: SOS response-associated peptidase [Opitutaceae bacterium]
MCGRYTLHPNKRVLAKLIAQEIPLAYEPDYNIGPGRETLALANRDKNTTVSTMMHWGLKTPQNFHINARLETADTTPRFRDSWELTRCLLPANGFYEWYQDGITKVPYYIYPADGALTYFAGLWVPAALPGIPPTCVVLTTAAHESIKGIHDRMPVMLEPDCHADWLSGKLSKPSTLELAASVELQKHTVSRRVNSTQNKDSGLIDATSPLVDDQMMLF